jgi:hypothetical protein
MKNFKEHFWMLHDKIANDKNFAFLRFSDGELRILQNLELKLAQDHFVIGASKKPGYYASEDHKHFDPKQHQFFQHHLMESYKHKADNYFVGLSCRCCVGDADFKQQVEWYGGDHPNLTWANLWVNGNYPLFRAHMMPLLAKKQEKGIVYVVNEHAILSGLPFKVKKDFRVGPNCIINDYSLIETMKDWVLENDIKDHIFLFSASSLSNVLQYELFKIAPQNTYIDVGTCFNAELKMQGRRGYLIGGDSLNKTCVW